jgi:hypothetical protein
VYYSDLLIVHDVNNYRRLSILPSPHLPGIVRLERELLLDIVNGTGPGLEPAVVGIVDIKTLVYLVSFRRTGGRPLLTVGSCKQVGLGISEGKGLLS